MKCEKCGATIPEDSRFCPKCGSEIKKTSTSTANTKTTKILLYAIAIGIWVLILQNMGILKATVDINLKKINGYDNVFYNSSDNRDKYYRIPVESE